MKLDGEVDSVRPLGNLSSLIATQGLCVVFFMITLYFWQHLSGLIAHGYILDDLVPWSSRQNLSKPSIYPLLLLNLILLSWQPCSSRFQLYHHLHFSVSENLSLPSHSNSPIILGPPLPTYISVPNAALDIICRLNNSPSPSVRGPR